MPYVSIDCADGNYNFSPVPRSHPYAIEVSEADMAFFQAAKTIWARAQQSLCTLDNANWDRLHPQEKGN